MISPIKFAIIGSGAIAETHIRALEGVSAARLTAICARNQDRAKQLAQPSGAALFSSVDELLAARIVDAVIIATPSGLHQEAATPCLRAGKHVLCEKPLEISVDRISQMTTEARQAGVLLAGFFPLRCGSGAQTLKKAIGRFGKLAFVSARIKWWRNHDYYAQSSWRGSKDLDGGGALMNQGIHAVDLLQWIAGLPVEVAAFSAALAHPNLEVEDTLAATLRFSNGAVGTIEAATSCYPGLEFSLEVSGDRGTAVLVNDQIVDWRFSDSLEEDDAIRQGTGGAIKGGTADPKAISAEGHRRQIEAFCRKVLGENADIIDGVEAGKSVAIIEAIYRSTQSRRFECVETK